MENNKQITLPGNVDVSLVDGIRREFIIHAIYDPASSSIRDRNYMFTCTESAEEIINAIKNNYDVKIFAQDLNDTLYHIIWVDFMDGLLLPITNTRTGENYVHLTSAEKTDVDSFERYFFYIYIDESLLEIQFSTYTNNKTRVEYGINDALLDTSDDYIMSLYELVDATPYILTLNLTSGNNPQAYATASDVYYAVTRHPNNTSFYLSFNSVENFYTVQEKQTVRLVSVVQNGSTWNLSSEVFFAHDGIDLVSCANVPYIISYSGPILNNDTLIIFDLHSIEELDVGMLYTSDPSHGNTSIFGGGVLIDSEYKSITINASGITDLDYSGNNSYANTVWNVIGGTTQVATPSDINTVTAIAEGKTKAYVTNKTKMSALNSSNDTVTISSFTDLNNTTVALSNFKVGDIVYLTDTEIPDRWVSSITKSGNTVTALVLSKMETSKVDLNSYVLKTTTIAGVDLQDNITKAELQSATDDSTHRFVTDTEKSTWNNKVSSTTITAIQVVSSMPASPDSNTLYIVQ